MKFKATIRKLRLVLVVIAALTLYLSVVVMFPMKHQGPVFMLAILGMILTLTDLYLSVSLKRHMAKSPRTLTMMLLVTVCWLIVGFLVTMKAGNDVLMAIATITGVVLVWYAIRVSKQLATLPAPEPAKKDSAGMAAATTK